MRSLFFGTPAIAVSSLEALAQSTTVVGVVCQPDRPAGRGLKLSHPATKEAAQRLGIPVYQPEKVRSGELLRWMRQADADVAIVVAYGRILPPDVLAAPRHGCLNLHASILPRYRGAAPIQRALMNGEIETGMALMQMDEGLDTGPVYSTRRIQIPASMNAEQLTAELSRAGAEIILEDLPLVLSGELKAQAQDASQATFAPPLTAADLSIDFSKSAREIHNQVRGLAPRPAARTSIAGKLLKILATEVVEKESTGEAGKVLLCGKAGIVVQTGKGTLKILFAQVEGKRALDAAALANGRALREGDVLPGEQGA